LSGTSGRFGGQKYDAGAETAQRLGKWMAVDVVGTVWEEVQHDAPVPWCYWHPPLCARLTGTPLLQ
jgi:hypothetical protein